MRESYVEGTTFSGGLPPYVSNRLVDIRWFYVEDHAAIKMSLCVINGVPKHIMNQMSLED